MAEKKSQPPKEPSHSPEFIRDVSEAIYRARLNEATGGGPGAVDRMIEKDGDDGKKLRGRAAIYDPIVRVALDVLKIQPGFKL